MNRIIISSLTYLFILIVSAKGQANSFIKNPAIGIHFIANDFLGSDYLRSNGLGNALRSSQFFNLANFKSGLALSYLQGLAKNIDLSTNIAGSYIDYRLHDGNLLGNGNLLLELECSAWLKLLTDKHLCVPFLSIGVGASKYEGYYAFILPTGIGVQLNFSNEAFLLLNYQYRFAVTPNSNSHFFYSAGIAGNIFKKKKKINPSQTTPLPVFKISDRDGDGVPDSADVCPDIPGLKAFKGCPDQDGDGIPDNEDRCPTVPGLKKYQGCPIPDTDGDGINDEDDSCITVAGILRYHGCPIPDKDGDGVYDFQDSCPTIPGVLENHGCPFVSDTIKKVIVGNATKIFFKTGSHDLLPFSLKALDEVAKILQKHSYIKLKIEGHTDNVGSAEKNLILSEQRAAAVKKYLISKGIGSGRLSSFGYGLTKPIADNKTARGRAINRRVELKIE